MLSVCRILAIGALSIAIATSIAWGQSYTIALQKWLPAVWMLTNDKNGISSYELAKAIGVTQESAWFMLHRIRTALKQRGFGKTYKFGGDNGGGPVEVDEMRLSSAAI